MLHIMNVSCLYQILYVALSLFQIAEEGKVEKGEGEGKIEERPRGTKGGEGDNQKRSQEGKCLFQDNLLQNIHQIFK